MTTDFCEQLVRMYAEMIANLERQKLLMQREIFTTRDGNADSTRASILMCEDHIAQLEVLAASLLGEADDRS